MPTETSDVLSRVKRGLSAYVSYLAACEMNEAFSEYVLYEPILRILTARGFTVLCEVECPGIAQPAVGDKKRLDFYAHKGNSRFALEVKWAKSSKPNVTSDIQKLRAILAAEPNTRPLLCVFGRKSHIESLKLNLGNNRERGKMMYADLRITRYGRAHWLAVALEET